MTGRYANFLLAACLTLGSLTAMADTDKAGVDPVAVAASSQDTAGVEKIVDWASTILEEITQLPADKRAQFDALIEGAYGFAIFPNVTKAGLIFANITGRGVLVHRDAEGAWSLPILLSLGGKSIGPQIGAMSSDVLVVFKTEAALRGLRDRNLRGVDVQSGAGGAGAEIESYHTRRGLILGQSIDKTTLYLDATGNEFLYGQGIEPGIISKSTRAGLRPPPCVQKFSEQINLLQGKPAATLQWH